MVRVARKTDPKRIVELKKKINDTKYIDAAIQKIAQTLTNEIMQRTGDPH
jgi:hypothetical protein